MRAANYTHQKIPLNSNGAPKLLFMWYSDRCYLLHLHPTEQTDPICTLEKMAIWN